MAYFGRLSCSDVCGSIVGIEYSQGVPKQSAHHVLDIIVSVWKNVVNMEHICRSHIFFLAYFGRLSYSDVCGSIVGIEYSQRVPKQSAHHVLDITVSVWKNVANMEHICHSRIFFLTYFGRLSSSDVCGSIVGTCFVPFLCAPMTLVMT
jgi:hypothetical protein